MDGKGKRVEATRVVKENASIKGKTPATEDNAPLAKFFAAQESWQHQSWCRIFQLQLDKLFLLQKPQSLLEEHSSPTSPSHEPLPRQTNAKTVSVGPSLMYIVKAFYLQ